MKGWVKLIAAVMFATFVLGDRVEAQSPSPGDAYFRIPKIDLQSGRRFVKTLEFLTGDQPFGIAHAQVRYDPDEMELIAINKTTNIDTPLIQKFQVEEGLIDVIVVNPYSRELPLGSVQLASMIFLNTALLGNTAIIEVTVLDAFTSDVTAYASKKGINGEVYTRGPFFDARERE